MLEKLLHYSHGFVAIPVILACREEGVFDHLKKHGPQDLKALVTAHHANSGHLKVALVLLQSLGWLTRDESGAYELTEGYYLNESIPDDLMALYNIQFSRFIHDERFYIQLDKWVTRISKRWGLGDHYFAEFLDGVLVVPIFLALTEAGHFKSAEPLRFSGLPIKNRDSLFSLFQALDFATITKKSLLLNEMGKFIVKRILNTAAEGSYAPMLYQIGKLLFGDPSKVFVRDTEGHEAHVNRTLNVIASGFQHERYFAEVDGIIEGIFNREPLSEQPKYVADMGCGDGTFLKRIYQVIKHKTKRGQFLVSHPLKLLGIDYNEASLKVTDQNLQGLPHLVIHGDIGDPEKMEQDLIHAGIVDVENILHVRSFLDHDRPYRAPTDAEPTLSWQRIHYPGVFVQSDGQSVSVAEAQQSLVEHLERWGKLRSRFGLILMEVHTLSSEMVYEHMHRCENLHFDATQAFSMQHLVASEAFLIAAAQAGLYPNLEYFRRYPKTFPFTRITLNLYERRPFIIRHAHPDDLPQLVNLEEHCWHKPMRAPMSMLAQRLKHYPEGQLVLVVEGKVVCVIYSQRITSAEQLLKISYRQLSQIRNPEGQVLQLLGLNELPDKQYQGLGAELLNFMLRYCMLKSDIRQIAGVTRCVAYVNHPDLSMQAYIRLIDDKGLIQDPVPRFHMKHGAVIKGIVEDYRPEDVDNDGYGLVIMYDLKQLELAGKTTLTSKKKVPEKITEGYIREQIEQAMTTILGVDKMQDYTPDMPLMDLGFDSLALLELKTLLSERLGEPLHPTFFFRYSSAAAMLEYFVENKLNRYRDWLYTVEWSEQAPPLLPLESQFSGLTWLIFANESDFWNVFTNKLDQYGCDYVLIKAAKNYSRIQAGKATVRPDHPGDFKKLFCSKQLLRSKQLRLIYGWGLVDDITELPSIKQLKTFHQFICEGLLNSVKALSEEMLTKRVPIIVVSWGFPEKGAYSSLFQSPMIGLAKAIESECPEHQLRQIALDQSDDIRTTADHLFLELFVQDHEERIVWQKNMRLAPRLIRVELPDAQLAEFQGEASYLITGGLGGLGLSFARWYVDRGVRQLILVDNDELTSEAKSVISELEAHHVHVKVYDCFDFNKTTEMRKMMAEIKSTCFPLKGVLHIAGLIDDDSLFNLDWSRFKPIFDLKVVGAWQLHCFTQALNLDHFVMFSSVGATMGPLWRANRSAANTFLDALAHYRCAQGLPALTINWGPWDHESMPVQHVIETNLTEGLPLLTVEQGIEVIDHLINVSIPQVLATPVQWGKFLKRYSAEKGLFRYMASEHGVGKSELVSRFTKVRIDERHESIRQYLRMLIRRVLLLRPTAKINDDEAFDKLGLDEKALINFKNQMQFDLGEDVPVNLLLVKKHPSITELSQAIYPLLEAATSHSVNVKFATSKQSSDHFVNQPIAIIGIGCRFPGKAVTPDAFWRILEQGLDVITEVPPERWDMGRYYDKNKDAPGKMYTRFGGFIDEVDAFDPWFFGISPREAEDMDPQQRISLEVAWEALENAAIAPRTLKGTNTGVFVGICFNDYGQLITQSGDIAAVDNYYSTGNHYSVSAGRIAYVLGLEGPAMAIDTACSSSLVTLDIACEKLSVGQCNLAIAGGVNLILAPEPTVNFCKSGMLSTDGKCKTFDAMADGYVRSEGCGMLILKRLEDAKKDGDNVLAVIRATAVNHDGTSAGLTVPNGKAQEKVIETAIARAGIDPQEVSYVEVHGTGTELGDPIEVDALCQVYGHGRKKSNPLRLGALKSNMGHAEAAAGVAGVIKTVLALQHHIIPENLHFNQLNPKIHLTSDAIEFPKKKQDWNYDGLRLAAVSSFGFSGTNAHLIIQEAEPVIKEPSTQSTGVPSLHLLTLSAKTKTTLKVLIRRYLAYLETTTESLSDITYTANVCRNHEAWRMAVIAKDVSDLKKSLKEQNFLFGEAKKLNNKQLFVHYEKEGGFKTQEDDKKSIEIMVGPKTRWLRFLNRLAKYYIDGVNIDWATFHSFDIHHKVQLPTYPFQHKRYWASVLEQRFTKDDDKHLSELFYKVNWVIREPMRSNTFSSLGKTVLIGKKAKFEKILADQINKTGGVCTLVSGKLNALFELQEADVEHIIFSSSYDVSGKELLLLAQSLVLWKKPPALWIVTQSAQNVLEEEPMMQPQASVLLGLGKVIALEHPELHCRRVDCDMRSPIIHTVEQIISQLCTMGREDELAFRGGQCYVPRLQKYTPKQNVTPLPSITSDASYMIIGGLGGIGGVLIDWFVKRGAKHLIVTGRHPPTAKLKKRFKAYEEQESVVVDFVRSDVSHKPDVDALFLRIKKEGWCLKGIVHAAGIMNTGFLRELTWRRCAQVLAPKVQGAWYLYEALQAYQPDCDFVVFLTSVSGVLGSVSMGCYAAGNYFLDQLAAYARQHGLPTQSLAWGPWSNVGMVAKEAEREVALGYEIIAPREGIKAFEMALHDQSVQLILNRFNWPVYFKNLPLHARLYKDFLLKEDDHNQVVGQLLQQLASVPVHSRLQIIKNHVRVLFNTILKIPEDQVITDEQNVFEVGLDSLMAVEFRNHFQISLGSICSLPASIVLEHPSIESLSETVLRLLPEPLYLKEPLSNKIKKEKELDTQQRFPLTAAQERMWFFYQLEPESTNYNIDSYILYDGPIDRNVLEKSINAVVSRHESLRAIFSSEDSLPYQRILPEVKIALPLIDLSSESRPQQEKKINQIISESRRHTFNLESGPMLRSSLICLSERKYLLNLGIHHICIDGVSAAIIKKELSLFYQAYSQNQDIEIKPTPPRYTDYVLSQKELSNSIEYKNQVKYWHKLLEDAPHVIHLPQDKKRSKEKSFKVASCQRHFSQKFDKDIQKYAKQNRITSSNVLVSALALLLNIYSRDKRVNIGVPIANRHTEEESRTVGLFVNTIVLSCEIDLELTVEKFMEYVFNLNRDAIKHQQASFENVVNMLNIERDVTRHPLFQVSFNKQPTTLMVGNLGESKASIYDVVTGTPDFDFAFDILDCKVGFDLRINYNCNLYERATVDRMLKHYHRLLFVMLQYPNLCLKEISVLNELERTKLLVTWNKTQSPYPKEKTIADLFEAQVKRTPKQTAVVFEEESLSYKALNQKANQLAHYLLEKGVSQGDYVGVYIKRSIEVIISLCAVLKTGAVYVPLDPSYPRDRIVAMAENCHLKHIISQTVLSKHLKGVSVTLSLYDDQKVYASYPQSNPVRASISNPPLYVIHTSGSTGQPKGILMGNNALVNLIHWQQQQIPDSELKVTQFCALGFDVSVQEMFFSMLSGHTLCLLPEATRLDPKALLQYLCDRAIQVTFMAPVVLQALAEQAVNQDNYPPSLIAAIIAGEQLKLTEQIKLFFTHLPKARLINQYGPAETHVVSSEVLQRKNMPWPEYPSIGKPINNVKIYILNDALEPIPLGGYGELYIGGIGLSEGYVNLKTQTESRFLKDPFSPDGLMYKTGDLARWLKDGRIEYLGRVDFQVKIRGFRIELGEIETQLRQQKTVKDVVVLTTESEVGLPQLVAYVIPEKTPKDQSSFIKTLRKALVKKLPDYMIPAAFVLMEVFPLTPNGKLDRNALPEPEFRSEADYVPPRTPTEQTLLEIWQAVLRVEPIGIHANFFEIGGHSLLATQVVVRIKQAFEAEVAVKALFDYQTIATLAEHVDERVREHMGIKLPPIVPVSREEGKGLPLSYAQERLWFLDKLLPNKNEYNVPARLILKGKLKKTAFQLAMNQLMERHESLRTVFIEVSGHPQQLIMSPDAFSPLEYQDIRHTVQGLSEKALMKRLQVDADTFSQMPFDLRQGPLFKVKLIRYQSKAYLCLINFHHVVVDGWSLGVFVSEFNQLYQAACFNEPNPLPPLRVQYADYAVWQRTHLADQVFRLEQAYWEDKLADAPHQLNIPLDKPRPPVHRHIGKLLPLKISANLTKKLVLICREKQVTLFMLLESAYALLLSQYSRQSDILIGTPIANRPYHEIEPLIGFFVNTLVIRHQIPHDVSFSDYLAATRETILSAYENQNYPFEHLVDVLHPERDMSITPLFQAMFILQNARQETIHLPDLEVSFPSAKAETSKFDLLLSLSEKDNALYGVLEYNTDIFHQKTAERFIKHYVQLLESISLDPKSPVSRLSALSAKEKQCLVHDWNQTETPYPKEKTIADLFEAQVNRTPKRTALVFEEESLSYKALNQKANQLAHYLLEKGLSQGDYIGVYMKRSIEVIISLCAVLKTGAVYVPLDPSYPRDRIVAMAENCHLKHIISQTVLSKHLKGVSVTLSVYDDQKAYASYPQSNPIRPSISNPPLYVIHTSGSTGQPKGILMGNNALVNLVHWQEQLIPEKALRMTQYAALGFDVSLLEMMFSVSYGHTLYIVPEETRLDLSAFLNYLCDHKIQLLCALPIVLQTVAEQAVEQRLYPMDLKTVIVTGEQFKTTDAIHAFFEKIPACRVINEYGPAESHVVTSEVLQTKNMPWPEYPSIGKPINNVKIYILNDVLEPIPLGGYGELYIGGIGLSEGYINLKTQTESRFLKDPFSPDGFMYKTGDLARWLTDGRIEYLGRVDFQVKIRGFRIELGEIETQLRLQKTVKDVVVLAKESEHGASQLLAYVIASKKPQNETRFIKALRKALVEKLPDYMIPASFVLIEFFPLTPNGKLDRKALPEPEYQFDKERYVPPRNDTEAQLVEIWENILGHSPLGVRDNFFELGGHSLLAVRLLSMIKQTMHVDLPMTALFQGQTIEEFAELIESAGLVKHSLLVPLHQEGSQAPLFLVHAVGGSVMGYVDLARELGKYDRPVYGLQAEGFYASKIKASSIESMAKQYVREILSVQSSGTFHLGGWSFGGTVAFEMAKELQKRGHTVAPLLFFDCFAPSLFVRNTKAFPTKSDKALMDFLMDLSGTFQKPLLLTEKDLRGLSLEKQFRVIQQSLLQTHMITSENEIKDIRRHFDIFLNNFKEIYRYKTQPLPIEIVLFAAKEPLVDQKKQIQDKTHGWAVLCKRILTKRVSGTHYTMFHKKNVIKLAKLVRDGLGGRAGE